MRKNLLLAVLLIGGCARVDANADGRAPKAPATAAESPSVRAVSIDETTGLLAFHVAWPAEVSAIPALAEAVRQAALAHKTELVATAAADEQQRTKEDFPFRQYAFSSEYKVAGDTGRLLSLADDWYEYTGGAHPMHGTRGLLWDRQVGREIAFADLFAGGAASVDALLRTNYCAAVDKARAEKRGPERPEDGGRDDDPFYQCPKFAELALIPTGAAGRPMTQIRIHAAPYVAGPYAEGDYDIGLPLTPTFIAALKPEYRASFGIAQRQ